MLYEFLRNKLTNKKIILFGEIHGTKEIPELISKFFNRYAQDNDFNIALEIQSESQGHINNYLKTGKEDYLRKMSFFKFSENSDGRNSFEYFNLIRDIHSINSKYKRQIRIFCIDTDNIKDYKNQNKREAKLAENILKILSEKPTFIIMGSIHTSKNIINLDKPILTPTGNILYSKFKDKLLSILLWPQRGKYFNLEIKEIKSTTQEDITELIKNYDYTYFIDEITPCNFLK